MINHKLHRIKPVKYFSHGHGHFFEIFLKNISEKYSQKSFEAFRYINEIKNLSMDLRVRSCFMERQVIKWVGDVFTRNKIDFNPIDNKKKNV